MQINGLLRVGLIILICLIAVTVFAENVTFTKEYTYQASEFDSKHSSRTLALEQVKRLLLEELGTYLISETEVKSMQLTKDKVIAYSAGIVHAKIIDEKWDGKSYWLKSKVSADPQGVEKALKMLVEDKHKLKELEDTKKKAEELTKENARLRKELEAGAKAINRDKETEEKNIKAYKDTISWLDAIELLNKSYDAVLAKKWDEAIVLFTKVIELMPNFAEAYYGRGFSYDNLGNYQQAIKDVNKAIELKSDYADAYFYKCGVYGMSDVQQAIKNCSKAIELKPDYAEAYYGRGVSYGNLGNDKQAILDLTKAIQFKPDFADAYNSRGVSYGNSGNYQQAITDLTKAIRINPDYADAYYNRAAAYRKLGNYQLAINDYKVSARLGDKEAQEYLIKQNIKW